MSVQVPAEARKRRQMSWSPSYRWLGVTQHGCRELKPHLLQEQNTLLTTELSLQPMKYNF